MSYIWNGKKPSDDDTSRDGIRKAWSEPQVVRLLPGTPEYERARKVLLGSQPD